MPAIFSVSRYIPTTRFVSYPPGHSSHSSGRLNNFCYDNGICYSTLGRSASLHPPNNPRSAILYGVSRLRRPPAAGKISLMMRWNHSCSCLTRQEIALEGFQFLRICQVLLTRSHFLFDRPYSDLKERMIPVPVPRNQSIYQRRDHLEPL